MAVEFNRCNQSRAVEDGLKTFFYKTLNKAAQKSKCMRFTGLFVGIASGLSTIITRIALIAENIFKGAINILGCPFSKRCSFGTGLSQLLWGTTKNVVLLPFSGLSALIGLFTKTIFMAAMPKEYTNERWCAHDPAEVDNQRQAAAEARRVQERNAYLVAAQIYNSGNKDIANIKLLGMMFRNGTGVQKNAEHACKMFSEAANLGDLEAIHVMGGFYLEGYYVENNTEMAYQCFEQAANQGFAPSMLLMGCQYLKSDPAQAFAWFDRAAERDEPQALALGAKMIALGLGGNDPDLDKAVEWFERAHQHGDKSAAHYLYQIDLYREVNDSKWFGIRKNSPEPKDTMDFYVSLVRTYHHQ